MTTEWARCAAPIIRLPIITLGETDAVLMEDWHINDVCGFRFTIPSGTRTDGIVSAQISIGVKVIGRDCHSLGYRYLQDVIVA